MDHAGDVISKIQRGFVSHPWNDRNSISQSYGDRDKQNAIIRTSDGGFFRVTVEQIPVSSLTDEEMYLEDTERPFDK
jgi:hypothetical protein